MAITMEAWYSPDCTDRKWEINNRGNPGKILDYVRVKGTGHVVSHLHMLNRGDAYIRKR